MSITSLYRSGAHFDLGSSPGPGFQVGMLTTDTLLNRRRPHLMGHSAMITQRAQTDVSGPIVPVVCAGPDGLMAPGVNLEALAQLEHQAGLMAPSDGADPLPALVADMGAAVLVDVEPGAVAIADPPSAAISRYLEYVPPAGMERVLAEIGQAPSYGGASDPGAHGFLDDYLDLMLQDFGALPDLIPAQVRLNFIFISGYADFCPA